MRQGRDCVGLGVAGAQHDAFDDDQQSREQVQVSDLLGLPAEESVE